MFPEQKYSIRPELPKPALMGWAFFPCGLEDVQLQVGAQRECQGGGGYAGA